MDTDATGRADATQRYAPAPALFWLPGALMLWFGSWAVVDDEGMGWASSLAALGLTLVLIGGVAQGVAWGMDIHKERHP